MRKYALDTNIFIHAFRDRGWNDQLQAFRAGLAPFEHLSAVVAGKRCAERVARVLDTTALLALRGNERGEIPQKPLDTR